MSIVQYATGLWLLGFALDFCQLLWSPIPELVNDDKTLIGCIVTTADLQLWLRYIFKYSTLSTCGDVVNDSHCGIFSGDCYADIHTPEASIKQNEYQP